MYKSSSNRGDGSNGKITRQSPLGFVIQEIKLHSLLLDGILHLQITEQKPLDHYPRFYKEGNAQDLGEGVTFSRSPG